MEAQTINSIGANALKLRTTSPTSQQDFERTLVSAEVRQALTQAAEQFVSSALVLPLLQQMQEDPLRSSLMHSGFAEDAWQSQLNTILADRIVARSNLAIVDAIEQNMLKQYSGLQSEAKVLDAHG